MRKNNELSQTTCEVCGSRKNVTNGWCDRCWYGARMDPKGWVDEKI